MKNESDVTSIVLKLSAQIENLDAFTNAQTAEVVRLLEGTIAELIVESDSTGTAFHGGGGSDKTSLGVPLLISGTVMISNNPTAKKTTIKGSPNLIGNPESANVTFVGTLYDAVIRPFAPFVAATMFGLTSIERSDFNSGKRKPRMHDSWKLQACDWLTGVRFDSVCIEPPPVHFRNTFSIIPPGVPTKGLDLTAVHAALNY